MNELSVARPYEDGEILFAADFNAFIDNIEDFFNVTQFNDDNIQDSGITGSSKLANATITASKLTADSVSTEKVLNVSVTANKLAADAIDTEEIAEGAVTLAKVADDSVTSAQMTNEAVTASKLASNSVTSESFVDESVTGDKLTTGTNERNWVLGRTADATAGAIGTYAYLEEDGGGSRTQYGDTRSGSVLRPTSSHSAGGSYQSGTWRCVGGANSSNRRTVWLRIS